MATMFGFVSQQCIVPVIRFSIVLSLQCNNDALPDISPHTVTQYVHSSYVCRVHPL